MVAWGSEGVLLLDSWKMQVAQRLSRQTTVVMLKVDQENKRIYALDKEHRLTTFDMTAYYDEDFNNYKRYIKDQAKAEDKLRQLLR